MIRVLKGTVLEVLVLCALAIVLAVGANSLRGRDAIKLTRDYFPKATMPVPKPVGQTMEPGTAGTATPSAQEPGDSDNPAPHPGHEFHALTFEQTRELFEHPNTEAGVYLFVDARNDESFAEGRILGAMQCDHYRIDEHLAPLLEAAEYADKLIVYCNGGECEDSILLCRDLLEAGVDYEKLHLYLGGWTEWLARGMPSDKGDIR